MNRGMSCQVLLIPLLFASLSMAVEENVLTHYITEENVELLVDEYSATFVAEPESLISLRVGCFHTQQDQDFVTAFLRREDTKEIVASISAECAVKKEDLDAMYKRTRVFTENANNVTYMVVVTGAMNARYEVTYHVSKVRLNTDGTASRHVVSLDVPFIHTFLIDDFEKASYRYVDVTIRGWESQKHIVGKLIVTQDREELYNFLNSPNTSTLNSVRLSYSTFGRIVLFDVSKPALAPGLWMVGSVLFNEKETKNITINISPNYDYEYVTKIVILTVVSCLGVFVTLFARYIFNYMNREHEFSFAAWRTVVINWFYSGDKGLAYLTGFLAWMLLVSAFQVVHAKWGEMMEKGDRDICYYNEMCYKPYIGYYDVSVNGVASNLCFMVHGAIIILFVSLSETSCFSLKHAHYDYSIAYSFGMAFIFEGFGSLLYHICPSQIIFQFDTLFMFVISQYVITALVDGHAIRSNLDSATNSIVKTKIKSIRSPKLFLFFLGPAYGFNFLGNLHYIDPLPDPVAFFFFVFLGIWVIGILLWAAYKANLLPETYFKPARIIFTADGAGIREETSSSSLTMKLGFGGYTILVLIGFGFVVAGKLVISIFILGELIVALLIMTAASFVSLLRDLWVTLTTVVRKNDKKYPLSYRYIIPGGVVLYLICGMAMAVISLFFFVVLENTDKSIPAWESRELNKGCVFNNFWDAHDLWHFFASHSLMMIVLVVIQMSKPCRDCYMKYKMYQSPEENAENEIVLEEKKGAFHQEPVVLKILPLKSDHLPKDEHPA